MKWAALMEVVSREVHRGGSPSVLVIQLGENDIPAASGLGLRHRIMDDLRVLSQRLPNTYLMWSELLDRRVWRDALKPERVHVAKEKINREVRKLMAELGGAVIRHPDISHNPKIFAACLAHRPSAVLWLTTLGACFVVHGVCLLIFHYFLLLSTETQLPGTGPLESPAAPDVDSDSGASTNIDFIPGTQEEEQPGVLGPPARRRRIQIQDEVLSDEEEEPPLAPGSPPPRGALPAEERLTRERGRLRRVSVLTSVGERLLEHCYEESRRAAAADQAMLTLIAQEGRKLRAVLRETNQILREGVEEVRLIRRLMERAVVVMERAYPPQIAPPPTTTHTNTTTSSTHPTDSLSECLHPNKKEDYSRKEKNKTSRQVLPLLVLPTFSISWYLCFVVC
ncbi:uncharacterized protein LOC143844018 [Paroedura picta]|uniref:uncharacterized protein LOC143844018 n=1 Tax=Paroedura picta TaxID=143630 RepID=UPI004055B23B